MVSHGIPWYTMVYHGIPWYTMVCNGIPWYTMGYHGIPWYPWHAMVYHCIPWYTMAHHGIPWFCHGMPWYTMVHHGISWYTMIYHGILGVSLGVNDHCFLHCSPPRQVEQAADMPSLPFWGADQPTSKCGLSNTTAIHGILGCTIVYHGKPW